ncbi:DUF6887 family protein [Laspinema olomoucense]|uniref:DUF6887 family protein n=1 Tax=Laspinema olomoucense TaxID=3231600 RepID=UPI0021BB12A7|nr:MULTISPECIES: hypothetical protein [unclassified Laspinema]MCT7971437.1 hypothetical protein [Laspinema sp. D3d]MCT7987306.1 hypothetical protein [Laspinema sp. D3a]
MNPKFDLMSRDELKAYLLAHRDDLEALDALVNRRSPDSEATWYPAPLTEETIRISEEAIQRRIEGGDRPSPNFPS